MTGIVTLKYIGDATYSLNNIRASKNNSCDIQSCYHQCGSWGM